MPPCRRAAPCSFAPWRTWRDPARRRRPATGPSSYAPTTASRTCLPYGSKGNSTMPVWWSAIRYSRRVHPLAFRDRNPGLAVGIALIFGPRANQAIVAVLFEHMRGPAGHAAHREDRRVQIDGNAQRVIGRRRIEIHVRLETLNRLDGLFHGLRQPVQLFVTRPLAQFLGEHAQVRGARI